MTTFFRYVRNAENHPVACIATDGIDFGVSICCPGDQFNKVLGKAKAKGRLLSLLGRNVVPDLSRRYIERKYGLRDLSDYLRQIARYFVIEVDQEIQYRQCRAVARKLEDAACERYV